MRYNVFIEVEIFAKNYAVVDNNDKPIVIQLTNNNPNISELIKKELADFGISIKFNNSGWLTPTFYGFKFIEDNMYIVYKINYPLNKNTIKLKEGYQWIQIQ